ncbi:MAG: ATP-dependent Zn protease [Spirulina sp. SIO3F2]|nr:ATP-dependent Zn protease [Spirulina sp. SIO3F2]
MQQTTLNLIALGIFLMTLSVVLGPLIHLPQSVPAIATLGVLVLATADRFVWQGLGGTLLVDFVARFSEEHRERILHHEAGHFLAAYLYEIPVTDYSLSAWEAFRQGQPGFGGVVFAAAAPEASKTLLEQQQQVNRYCITLMAGIAAEQLEYQSVEGGGDDRRQLINALADLGLSGEAIRLKLQWAQVQAQGLIERNQAAYAGLVAAMRDRKPVADCLDLLAAQTATA